MDYIRRETKIMLNPKFYKTMRKISVIIILLSLLHTAYSQKTRDALYLKNGSVIYGRLIEIQNDSYKIRTSDGSVFVYSGSEVDKFINEDALSVKTADRPFGIGIESGFLIGTQQAEYTAPFSFMVTGSYKFNNIHSLAAGTGVEFLGVSYSPIFLQYKAVLSQAAVAPFIFARAGELIYAGKNEDENSPYYYERHYSGGFMGNLGTGIRWDKGTYEMNLSFSYRYARTSYTQEEYYSNPVTYKLNWRRLEVKFGIQF